MKRLGVVLVVACHGDPVIPPDSTADSSPDSADSTPVDAAGPRDTYGAVSGTRLKLTWLEAVGGARVFKELYDAERGEPCQIVPGAGGTLLCAPIGLGAQIAYADASCTQPVVRARIADDCAMQPRYATEFDQESSCDSSVLTRLHTVGAPLVRASRYWTMSRGSCVGGGEDQPDFGTYALGDGVSLDQLAQLTLGAPEGAGVRLQQRSYVSSDGMRLPMVRHDAALGVECFFESERRTRQCSLGGPASLGSESSDPACESHLATSRKDCPAPVYAVESLSDACPGEAARSFAIGAQAPASPLYTSSGDSCVATQANPGLDYYRVGATPVDLMELEPRLEGADARIRNLAFTSTEGGQWHDRYNVFDTGLDTMCSLQTQPDGSIGCLPGGRANAVVSTSYYLDASCTLPISLVFVPDVAARCGDLPLPRFATQYAFHGACPATNTAHAVESEHLDPVWQRDGTSCRLSRGSGRMFRVSAGLPPTTFGIAHVVTDP
ncbi:MAG: hypothetical protein WKG01_05080 [Kofleriaceae bacterium]